MRQLATATGMLVSTTLATHAFAQAPLSIDVAAECGTASELSARIVELAGAQAAARAEGSVRIEADARHEYSLDVQLPSGARRLHDADCHALVEAASVMVALSVNPSLSLAEAPAEPAEQTEPAPFAHEDTPVEAPAKTATKPRELHGSGWLEAGAVYGVVPSVSGFAGLGFSLSGRLVGAALTLDDVFPRRTAKKVGVRVQGPGASLLLTLRAGTRVRIGAGVSAHALRGRGEGVEKPRHHWIELWAAKLQLVAALWKPGNNELGLVLDGALPWVRPRFKVGQVGTVFRPAPLELGLGLRFSHDFF